MRLTTFSDYTLRVLMYLALDPAKIATIPEIAAAYEISENHLMKVVHQLGRSGVIESLRGKGGGIRLARPAEESSCRIAPACRLNNILESAFDSLYAKLDEYTLADLMSKKRIMSRLLKNE